MKWSDKIGLVAAGAYIITGLIHLFTDTIIDQSIFQAMVIVALGSLMVSQIWRD